MKVEGISTGRMTKNAARCKKCGTYLESKHRHDFVACPCGNFIDGGRDYLRYGGNLGDLEFLTEWDETPLTAN